MKLKQIKEKVKENLFPVGLLCFVGGFAAGSKYAEKAIAKGFDIILEHYSSVKDEVTNAFETYANQKAS